MRGKGAETPSRFAVARRICRPLPPILSQRLREWLSPFDAARQDNFSLVSEAQTGSLLEGTTRDPHFHAFSIHGYYDWRNVAIAQTLVSPGDTIIEIGANVGTETVSFSDLVGARGTVHAFEPLPTNVTRLRRAVELSRHCNIVVHACALSDKSGILPFVVPPEDASGLGHLAQARGRADAEVIPVEVKTLDSVWNEVGAAKLIVMDTEGEEVNILRGSAGYLKTVRPHLVLEAAPKWLARAGSRLSELLLLLEDMGYSAYRISRFGIARAESETTRSYGNWLCLSGGNGELVSKLRHHLLRCALMPCVAGLNPLGRCPR